ncbi:hypothetical protein [Enterobacter sp. CPE_E222]
MSRAKSQPALAVYAYDRLRKAVVAHVFGEHYGDAGASYEYCHPLTW